MGDYLYSRSVTELARIGRVDLVEVLSRAANEMSVGELRQLTSCDALRFTEEDYYRLIASKTASLMAAACEMGAVAGRAEYREPLSRFGHALGMAFQIVDDLLDYTEVESVTGKPAGQDLREHKVTLPLIAGMSVMGAAARADVERFFADPEPDELGIQRVIAITDEHGGLEYARARAAAFGERATQALVSLPPAEATDALRDLIAYVIERRS
jgi:octaprenyl-diphosphate synthase